MSSQVQVISFFFLSPYFLTPFTDIWANSCQYVNVPFPASAQGTPLRATSVKLLLRIIKFYLEIQLLLFHQLVNQGQGVST